MNKVNLIIEGKRPGHPQLLTVPGGMNVAAGLVKRQSTLDPASQVFIVDPGITGGLQAAIDAAVASRGDQLLMIRNGAVDATATIDFDKSGISLIGVDAGLSPLAKGEFIALLSNASFTDGPVATITQPCKIDGVGFVSRDTGALFFAGAAMLIGGLATAAPFGVHILNCRFPKWNVSNRIGISVEGSSNVLIEDCDFEGVGADFDAGIYVQGATQNLVVRNNHSRQCTAFVQFGAFAGGGPHIIMDRNIVEDGKVLDSQGNTATGFLMDNYSELAVGATYDASVGTLQAQGIQFSNNHYSE